MIRLLRALPARPGVRSVPLAVALLASCGGGTEPEPDDGDDDPVPVVTSLSRTTAGAGSPGFVLTVTGTGFVGRSVVRWNGAARSTTFGGATSLQASIPATDLAAPGTAEITVMTTAPGGGTSAAIGFAVGSVVPIVPAPVLTGISSSGATVGSAAFTLTATGSGFTSTTTLEWNGVALPTTVVGATTLTVEIPASKVGQSGSVAITAFTPPPGGGRSGPLTFTISNPTPVVTALSHGQALVGSPGFVLIVTGSGFVTGSVILWNGQVRPPVYVSSTELQITVPTADLAPPGGLQIAVRSDGPGGGTSPSLPFDITPATIQSGVTVNLRAASLVWDPARNLVFASVASADATHPNTVISIDPTTGALGTPVAVDDDPGPLVQTPDGQYLFVGSNAEGTVQRIDLAVGAVDLTIPLGRGAFGQRYAQEIAVVPGTSQSIVVARRYYASLSPNFAGAVAFDGAVARQSVIAENDYETNTLAFASATTLYGFQNASSGFNLYTLSLSPTGLAVTKTTPEAVSSFGSTLTYVAGRLYFSEGVVYDPVGYRVIKAFGVKGPQAVDVANDRAFYLTASGSIAAFELTGYKSLGQITPAAYPVASLIRWGSNGLAFRDASAVYLIRTNLVAP